MKTIRFNTKTARRNRSTNSNVLHIETDGCIVNITVGLHDDTGARVTRVDVQCDQYPGEPAWTLPDLKEARGIGIRVREQSTWDTLTKSEKAALREACGMAEAQPKTPEVCLAIRPGKSLERKGLVAWHSRERPGATRIAWFVITDEGRRVRRQDPETFR